MDSWLLGARRDPQSVTPQWDPHDQPLIVGVHVHQVKNVVAPNGVITELYRRDWNLDDSSIEQVFQRTLVPGGVSAWHAHERTTDRLFVVGGMARIVLYDARSKSKTCGELNVFDLAPCRPSLIVVPPKIWHGVANVGSGDACVINIVDHAYAYDKPDHFRLPQDTELIPHNFRTAD